MAYRWIMQNNHHCIKFFKYGNENGISYSIFVNKILGISKLRLGKYIKKVMRPSYFIFSANIHNTIRQSLYKKWIR